MTLSNLLTEELLGDKFVELAKTFVFVFVSPLVSVIKRLEFET